MSTQTPNTSAEASTKGTNQKERLRRRLQDRYAPEGHTPVRRVTRASYVALTIVGLLAILLVGLATHMLGGEIGLMTAGLAMLGYLLLAVSPVILAALHRHKDNVEIEHMIEEHEEQKQ